MKITKAQKGITLVALIITIIVLLILAVVAIRAVQGDGIIAHAKNAKEKAIEAQDKERIMLALNEWKIEKNTNAGTTFESFMKEKFGDSNVQAGSTAEEVNVTLENGNQYKVKADGTIEASKGINISKNEVTLILETEATKTAELTAIPSVIEGKITWSIPEADKNIATISTTTGDKITVTGVAEGSTTITVSCESYSKTCGVTVMAKMDHSEIRVQTIAKTGVYANNQNIKEVREGNIPIPKGFTYVKGDHIGGAVITDHVDASGKSDGNEFVWVPVNQINDMVMCQTHGASVTLDTTTLQCPTCGANTKLAGKLYATSIGNYFNENLTGQTYSATSGLREPANLTDSSYADNASRFTGTNVRWTQTLYENSFKTMAESVAKYKGFYVGRYEMSYNGTAKSVAGVKSAINNSYYNNWWRLYAKAKTYTQSSVESEMIWGSQYDAMMKWMAGNGITVTDATPTDLSIGQTVRNQDKDNRITGSQPKDKLSNVFDLLGNSYEWIQEASDINYRVLRGGYYDVSFSPSYRNNGYPTTALSNYGSRLSLYIK